jgi:hypothetical protein
MSQNRKQSSSHSPQWEPQISPRTVIFTARLQWIVNTEVDRPTATMKLTIIPCKIVLLRHVRFPANRLLKSLSPHVTSKERLDGFSWNLILVFYYNLPTHNNFRRNRTPVTGTLHESLHAFCWPKWLGGNSPSYLAVRPTPFITVRDQMSDSGKQFLRYDFPNLFPFATKFGPAVKADNSVPTQQTQRSSPPPPTHFCTLRRSRKWANMRFYSDTIFTTSCWKE